MKILIVMNVINYRMLVLFMSQLEIFDRSASSSNLELTNKTSENKFLRFISKPRKVH